MGRLEVIGAQVLTAKMLELPRDIRLAVEKTAMKEASEILVDSLRQASLRHVDTGALKSSFKHDIRKTKDGNAVIGKVGVDYNVVGTVERSKKGKRVFKKNKAASGKIRRPAKYYHLLLKGTQDRTTKAGHNRGIMPECNFRDEVFARHAVFIQRLFEKAAEEALKKWQSENLPF
ncbi:MAG: hypothetical protein FWE95_05310 [Planctomycetaceae bacterium]|nr:hypothetical protein [Planctomycetaceae bacterium]